MKRIKFNFSVLAIVLGSAIAVTQSSFTAAKAHRFDSQYTFNGNSLADDKNASMYSAGSGGASCDETAQLPCVISVPAGTTLSAWLNARTTTQVRDQAIDTKSAH